MGCGSSVAKPAAEPEKTTPEPATDGLPASREKLLTEIFNAIDGDGDGNITKEEYESRVTSATLKSAFDFIDQQGDSDGMIQLSEWLKVIGQLGANYTDEQFETEFKTLLEECAAAKLSE